MHHRSRPVEEDPRPELLSYHVLTIRDVTEMLLRRRVTVLAVMALVTFPAAAYSLLSDARYTATAAVMLELSEAHAQRPTMASLIDTQRDVIRSRDLIETTMTDLDLYDVDEYRVEPEDLSTPRGRAKALVNKAMLRLNSLMRQISGEAEPDVDSASSTLSPDGPYVGVYEHSESLFANALDITQSGESLVLNVKFTSINPTRAALVANYLAELYLERRLRYKQAAAERAETWLAERVARMRDEVLDAERNLANFRAHYQFRLDGAAAQSNSAVLYQELERQAEVRRAAYQGALARYYDGRGHVDSLSADARIVARAHVPTTPSSPSPFLIVSVSLVTSGILGCSLALFREQIDRRIRSARQVETSLEIPCLAVLPKMTGSAWQARDNNWLANDDPRSSYSRAIRTLSLRLMASGHRSKMLLVTSALSDEGKSPVAAGIAVALRHTFGGRVLLVDLGLEDAERTRCVGISDANAATTSLSSTKPGIDAGDMQTSAALQTLIQRDVAPGIDFLPASTRENAGNGLTVGGTAAVLNALRSKYDTVVIDGPPLLGGADGGLVAMHTDVTLLVGRLGHTTVDAAGAGLALLRGIGVHVVGMVLTRGKCGPSTSPRTTEASGTEDHEDLRLHI